MQWLGTSVVSAAIAGLLTAVPATSAPVTIWSPPVAGAPVRPFVDGFGLYEVGGHAGVDYAPAQGSMVSAAGDGTVAFSGLVAGARFVVVDHGDGIRTSYGQLAGSSAGYGDRVERGERLGTSGGGGMAGHADGLFHFGLRVGGAPVDPMLLFAPVDLTGLVRLVPADEAIPTVDSEQAEREEALTLFGPRAPPEWLMFAQEPSGGVSLGQVVSTLANGGAALMRGGIALSPLIRESVAVIGAAGSGAADWFSQRGECSSGSAGTVDDAAFSGTGNHLFVVSGLNSFSRADGSTSGLAPGSLGYPAGDVSWFSYAQDGGAFAGPDTHIGPEAAAARLASQLRAFARTHPGRRVDLVGHSQGGVVIEAFLKRHYAGRADEYPPLGEVVTLAAPHRGTPLAALVAEADDVPGVDELAGALGQPAPSSVAVQQLQEGSGYLEALATEPLPPGVDMTTVGAVGDLLVTADQTRLAGATHVVVDPGGLWQHEAVLREEPALQAVRLALTDQPPRCVGLVEAVRNRVEPTVLHGAFRVIPELVSPALF